MVDTEKRTASDIYRTACESGAGEGSFIATVISGGAFGEKALFSGGKISACTDDNGFFRAYEADFSETDCSGIRVVDGQEVYVETLGNEKQAIICGAGHLALPIIRIMKMLDMSVTVIDDREEFSENAVKSGADRVICRPFAEAMKEVEGDEDTFFIVVTRGHRYDKDCVGGALRKRHAYVGMIGSKRHARFVKESLREENIPDELIDSVYTPIGVDIGAETPEEIAVSIAAEVIEIKNRKRRNSGFTKDMMKEIVTGDRDPVILATIVKREGSAPRTAGSKMIVRRDASIAGTIGGGVAEANIIKYAAGLLNEGFTGAEIRHEGLRYSAEDNGPVCGGAMDVLLESI